jgi:hypothetical protein
MGYLGLVLALFTLGYILGVWTAFAVLRQPQRTYEDAPVQAPLSGVPVILLHDAANLRYGRG